MNPNLLCTDRSCGYITHGDGKYHLDHQQRMEARMWAAGADPAQSTINRIMDLGDDPVMTRETYLREWVWDYKPIDLCPYWRSPEPRRALIAAGWPVSAFPYHWTEAERRNVAIPEDEPGIVLVADQDYPVIWMGKKKPSLIDRLREFFK